MPRGGARPGAGRPRKSKEEKAATSQDAGKTGADSGDAAPVARDPLQFLLDVMQGTVKPSTDQLRAGIAAAQYVHSKAQEGKRSQTQKEAESASGGRFKSGQPPLRVVNGK